MRPGRSPLPRSLGERGYVSLRLGHRSALMTIQVVIHSLAAANATPKPGEKKEESYPLNAGEKETSRRRTREKINAF